MAMALSTATVLPGSLARALGAAGVLGGLVLLAAIVTDIRPDLNWIRLVLFNIGAIAVGIALSLCSTAPRAAIVLTQARSSSPTRRTSE